MTATRTDAPTLSADLAVQGDPRPPAAVRLDEPTPRGPGLLGARWRRAHHGTVRPR